MTKHLVIPKNLAHEKRLERSREHYHNNPEYYWEWQRNNVASRLVSVAKQRAKKKNILFCISKKDITVPTHCPILGTELQMNQHTGAGGKDNSYSLDRIDPSKGYIPGNVWVISHKANSMKFTATKTDLLLFAKWINKTYDQTPGSA